MQSSLLPMPDVEVLVDDASGRIVYRRGLFDEAQARAWFEELRAGAAWRSERRPMYDRVVDVPRLVASFALDGGDVPEAILGMRAPVQYACGVTFTSAGLNFYRDGSDSVAP